MSKLINNDGSYITDFFNKNQELVSTMMETLNKSIVNDYNAKREQQITEALQTAVYVFKNRQEIEQFMKDHCTLYELPDKTKMLSVDGDPLCQWNDTVKITQEGNVFSAQFGY